MRGRLDSRFPVLAFLTVLLAGSGPVAGQPQQPMLAVRLVAASHTSAPLDARLQDVAPLLKANLAFRSFTLLESRTTALPAAAPIQFEAGYRLLAQGPADDLQITIARGRRPLLQTKVRLTGRAPLILGGIPHRNETLLFILNRP